MSQNNTLAKREQNQIDAFTPQNMADLERMAGMLAKSALIPTAVRNKPADVAIIIMHGRELGLPPMRALSQIYVVEGKPTASADLMVSLCTSRPTICKYFRPVEVTDRAATYETLREGHPEPTRFTYTIEDARAAGLTGKHNWKSHPKAMLSARAKSFLARMVYSDLVGGMYDPDESDEIRATAARDVTPPVVTMPTRETVAQSRAVEPVVTDDPPALSADAEGLVRDVARIDDPSHVTQIADVVESMIDSLESHEVRAVLCELFDRAREVGAAAELAALTTLIKDHARPRLTDADLAVVRDSWRTARDAMQEVA